MKPIKTIRSHTGYARFLAETDPQFVGEIQKINGIPSPYHYSPAWPVMQWNGKHVFARETSHKVYQIFEVPADMNIYPLNTF